MAGVLAENGSALQLENGQALLLEGSGGPALGAGALSASAHLTAGAVVTSFGSSMHASPALTATGFSGPPGAHLAAAPVLRSPARVIVLETAHLSASPSLTATGLVPMFLARPALLAAAQVVHLGGAALHAPGSLHAATSQSAAALAAAPRLLAPGRMAAARLLAGTSLSASGQFFMPGQAVLFGGAQLHATGRNSTSAAAALRASTALSAAALNKAVSSASLSAAGHLATAASSSAAHLAASPALAAAGRRSAVAAAHLTAPGTSGASARITERASAALHGSPALTAGAVPSRAARGLLSAVAALSATGAAHQHVPGSAALRAASALRAAGLRGTFGAARLTAAPVLTPRGARAAVARAAFSAQAQASAAGQALPGARMHASASLSGSATAGRAGHAPLSGSARLTGTAHGTTFPRAALTAPGAFTPAPDGIVQGALSLACSPALAASAVTAPGRPFPLRPGGQQPAWQRDVQRFAVVQERQRHAQALWQYGELVVFALMWRPQDIGLGLARRCTRCYVPAQVISDLPPETPPPLGWATAAAEAQISAAYGQGNQFRCALCFGTQVIAAGEAQAPGVRALIVRPAILTDTDQNQQRSAKGVVSTGQVSVQSTPDFRVHTLDYFFRADGRRYQLMVPARTTLRTGFGSPWQASAAISYNLASAALEDPKASAAYAIPPPAAQVERVLGTYTRVPADYAWFEQVNGPLIPGEEPSPSASGLRQPAAVLGAG